LLLFLASDVQASALGVRFLLKGRILQARVHHQAVQSFLIKPLTLATKLALKIHPAITCLLFS
jgi:hypothetical protein